MLQNVIENTHVFLEFTLVLLVLHINPACTVSQYKRLNVSHNRY
jgi:hypothetical protein